jgi:hypothetical protein
VQAQRSLPLPPPLLLPPTMHCQVGTLEPLDGMVKRHNHLRIGQYHQHLTELLDPELTPLEVRAVPSALGCGAVATSLRLRLRWPGHVRTTQRCAPPLPGKLCRAGRLPALPAGAGRRTAGWRGGPWGGRRAAACPP